MSRHYSKVLPTSTWPFFLSHDGRLPEKRGHRPTNMPVAYTIAYTSIVSHYPRYAVTLRTSVQTFLESLRLFPNAADPPPKLAPAY